MPITPLLALGWIAVVMASFFAAPILVGQVEKLMDMTIYKPAAATTPVTNVNLPPNIAQTLDRPSVAQDLVNQPLSMVALAAILFGSVFVIAQLRAAGRDASDSLKETTGALRDPVAATSARS